VRTRVEIAVVQGNGKGAITKRRGAIHELMNGMRNAVGRVVVCMCVQLDFEHC
jgi:hypothetical protein